MLFTHDAEVSLMGAAALVNTMAGSVPGDDDVDRLTTPEELDRFYASWRWTGNRATGEAARAKELRDVRALRPRLRELWFLDEDGAVEAVNALTGRSEAALASRPLPRAVAEASPPPNAAAPADLSERPLRAAG